MKLTLRQAPLDLPVTTQEILDHLRINESNPSDLNDILRIAAGCAAELDGPTGKLRRCLTTQQWSLWLDCWRDCIKVPLPPLQSVTAIKYLDSDEAWQTLDSDNYRVIDGGDDRSEIVLAPSQSWPAVALTPACIEIQFTAGYGDEDDIPGDLKNAVLEMTALRYSVRDGTAFASDRVLDNLPAGLALQRYRVYA